MQNWLLSSINFLDIAFSSYRHKGPSNLYNQLITNFFLATADCLIETDRDSDSPIQERETSPPGEAMAEG